MNVRSERIAELAVQAVVCVAAAACVPWCKQVISSVASELSSKTCLQVRTAVDEVLADTTIDETT